MTDSTLVIRADGTKFWYDEYSVADSSLNCFWLRSGEGRLIHREDGPAIEYPNGTKAWFLYGRQHRTDGPAVERTNGENEWFIFNKPYSEIEFLLKTRKDTSREFLIQLLLKARNNKQLNLIYKRFSFMDRKAFNSVKKDVSAARKLSR